MPGTLYGTDNTVTNGTYYRTLYDKTLGDRGSTVVKVLCYKSEGLLPPNDNSIPINNNNNNNNNNTVFIAFILICFACTSVRTTATK